MIQTVYYVVKSKLHYYPPCVSQIRMLRDLGVDVKVLYGSSEGNVVDQLEQLGIPCIRLCDPRGKLPGKLDKMNNWISFRKAFLGFIRGQNLENAAFWFGNAESMLPLKGVIEGKYHYVISFLELLDTRPDRIRMLKKMANAADAVTTCETTRSYLMQNWFGLNRVPFTIPNKPYFVGLDRRTAPTTEAGQKVLEQVDGHRFVIYQGIFQNYEYLQTVAEVLRDCYPDVYFVMMGIDREQVVPRIQKINPHTVYSPYIPAPNHLEVTSNAEMGVLFYEPDSLNKVFCAPNKIYEYSYFGLPILGNKIPGLENTIGAAGAGVCTEFTYEKIKAAFSELFEHYDRYSDRAKAFYQGTDNLQTMKEIVELVGIARNEA